MEVLNHALDVGAGDVVHIFVRTGRELVGHRIRFQIEQILVVVAISSTEEFVGTGHCFVHPGAVSGVFQNPSML